MWRRVISGKVGKKLCNGILLSGLAVSPLLFSDYSSGSTLPLNSYKPPTYNDPGFVLKEIKKLGIEVSATTEELARHSDSWFSTDHPLPGEEPAAIVFPTSTEEVSKVLKLCHENQVPIVPFTGGTSLEGHFINTKKSITIDLSRMDQVIELHKDDLDIVVQPGVGWEDLRTYLDDYGLMFGPDPGPGACIGGMAATSCSGTNAARYGTMKENVINLTVVLADGTIVKTRRRPRKSAAGYNLTGLIIGSEGTLGIVTEITLKLHVKPKWESVVLISFPNLKHAAGAVTQFIQTGLILNAIELLDSQMMKFVNDSGETESKYEELDTLLIKVGGSSNEAVDLTINEVKNIAHGNNATTFKFAATEEEKFQLWNARKTALWSTIAYGKKHIDPNIQIWSTDVAVPISSFVESLEKTRLEIKESGLTSSIVGHAGDGNYHALILFKEEERALATELVARMVERALDMDGTVSGEHGIGIGKKEFLVNEVGQNAVDLMRRLKFAVDPNGILNPDKVFKIDPINDRSV
ncbi:hypothetical protein CANINC_002687 [Pichia inconspicua]|uniref:D-lactate dehydrogenase (cytochrome) n=1 Tax=Pichia inconspicua TaxID=52247 RepID=A0A4T0X297_9ASCO|nr:hypothetical protein CANINC_002687 [[Candida] inconspicua]